MPCWTRWKTLFFEVPLLKILVIIPCYNESQNICQVVENLRAACPQVDYLVVNDCSTDNSVEILQAKGYNYLDLPVNLGIGGGVQCGYRYAPRARLRRDRADGRRRPARPRLPRGGHCPWPRAGSICASAAALSPKRGFQTSFLRRVGIRFLSGMIWLLTGRHVRDVTSGYRACGKALTNLFADQYAQDYPQPEAILRSVVAGYRVGSASGHGRAPGGVSSIRAFKSIYYMIKVSLSLVIYRLSFTKKRR